MTAAGPCGSMRDACSHVEGQSHVGRSASEEGCGGLKPVLSVAHPPLGIINSWG